MAEDTGVRVFLGEGLEQLEEGMLLSLGARIVSLAFLIQTSFIDDAKRTVVVVLGVDALDSFRKEGDDIATATDIVVIGALAVLGFAAGNQVLNAERAVALVGDTVHNQQRHTFQGLHTGRNQGFRANRKRTTEQPGYRRLP